MGINLEIQSLKEKIAKNINESGLPAGITLLVINEFSNSLQDLNMQSINAERQAEKEQVDTKEN